MTEAYESADSSPGARLETADELELVAAQIYESIIHSFDSGEVVDMVDIDDLELICKSSVLFDDLSPKASLDIFDKWVTSMLLSAASRPINKADITRLSQHAEQLLDSAQETLDDDDPWLIKLQLKGEALLVMRRAYQLNPAQNRLTIGPYLEQYSKVASLYGKQDDELVRVHAIVMRCTDLI